MSLCSDVAIGRGNYCIGLSSLLYLACQDYPNKLWLWRVESNHLFLCAQTNYSTVHCNLRIRHQNISVVLRLTDGRELGGWCRTTVLNLRVVLVLHYYVLSRNLRVSLYYAQI